MNSSATASVRPGFPTASPYLIFRDAAKALAFYERVFGVTGISRHTDETGSIRHAEFRIGDSTFMATSETPQFPGMKSAETLGVSPVHVFLYLPNPDEIFARAVAEGSTVVMPMTDQPYGRSGGFEDPFRITWWVSTHKEMSA